MHTTPKIPLQKIPVYEIRLVQSRRPLRLAEPSLSDANLAIRTLHAMLRHADREHFVALFLNGQNQVTGAHVVAIGGQQGINIEPRTVFRAAIAACASALIIGHNHPSQDPSPSPEDLHLTAKLAQAGKLLGIPVLDHIIVTRDVRRSHSMLSRGTFPDEA